MSTKTETTLTALPAYKLAQDEAKALFESLGIKAMVSAPFAHNENDWRAIAYTVTFTNKHGASFATIYKLGIGHVDLKKRVRSFVFSDDETRIFEHWQSNPNVQFKNKDLQLAVAVKLAKYQKLAPTPHEVFASICRDGTAHESTFQDWTVELGYDADSIKHKAIYDACVACYHDAMKVLAGNKKDYEQFVELANRF